MKLLVFVAIILFVETGCQRHGSYRNMDKWFVHRDREFRPINDHPKEVIEYNYRASDTDKPEKRRKQFDTYGFNSVGDLISRQIFLHDTLLFTWKGGFDSNGNHWVDTDMVAHQIETRTSRPLGDGRYKVIDKFEDKAPYAEIVAFSQDGGEFMRSMYDDTFAQGKPEQVDYFYDGIRLSKIEGSSKKADFEKRYYYSRWDTPDSIELYAIKLIRWVVEREYYLINSHGDPTRYIRVAGKDTSQVYRYQYVYDEHGNWTRKVTVVVKDKTTGKHDYVPGAPKVVDREIVY
jgi:hypothetical protein